MDRAAVIDGVPIKLLKAYAYSSHSGLTLSPLSMCAWRVACDKQHLTKLNNIISLALSLVK